MDTPAKIYHVNQGDLRSDKQFSPNPLQDYLYFFRFIGGNPSETEGLIENLRALKDKKPLVIGIFRFPFRFEGKKRLQTAAIQYLRVKELCDAVIYFQSDALMELIDDETPLHEANSTFDAIEEEAIHSLTQLLENSGDINIDFHDIEAFIRKNKGALFLHTVEGDSFDIPLKYLISAPYLPEDFIDGKQLIINIGYTRGVNMEMFRQLNLRLHDLFSKAEPFKIGSYFIDEPGERFKITLVVNGIEDPVDVPDNYKELSKYKELYFKWQRLIEKGKRRLQLLKNEPRQ
ncbi:FtsZ/tubulin family protein [Alkalibacillus aidingensis]|uniref:cell division protein FtsZ n=1 Tax=Alkalibacillus aidingensis TaxID=2747607 RepID=UPI00166162AD|nr:cell division protein FtsZ [Alkalibacillus aidingensis]